MLAYVIRRLGILFLILFGSSFILYNLAAISGDPIGELRFSDDPGAAQAIIDLTRQLRLDVPPPLRYFIWLKGVVGLFWGKADFGLTRDSLSVATEIGNAIPVSIRLVFVATFVAIVIGIAIGIASALRQYSRFDYTMTFFAFLLFSLPIFWVAVLLKQYMAIQFNNFLSDPKVPFGWLLTLSTITHISVGLSNRTALNASLTMSVFTLGWYFAIQPMFNSQTSLLQILGLGVATTIVATITSLFFSRIDRGPLIRTTILTALLSAFLIVVDKYMKTWSAYMSEDAVNYRPVPTFGQSKPLLPQEDYWIRTLDILVHLLLPTIALTLISLAGYVRFSRGTLLEVLNQDYIRTARAKGLTERTVIMRHAFRNTLIPLTTILVADIVGIIGGAIITERVFGWYGMGTLFNKAIATVDLNLLMGVFFITATLAVLANLIADLLYSALDPRIRAGSGK